MGEARLKREQLARVSPLIAANGADLRSGPRLSHPVTRDGRKIPFFPIGRRVIVERIPPETTIGGFFIPESHQAPQQYATVIAAGPAAQGVLDDAGIAIGDTICFGKYTGVFFDWQPEGTEGIKERRRVDVINIDDIYGCAELAEKLYNGSLGLMLYVPEDGSSPEYRLFEEQKR